MTFNLADLPPEGKEKITVDMAAGGVAFKERYGLTVSPVMIEQQQPEHPREYFRQRLVVHRATSKTLGMIVPESQILPPGPKR